MYFEKGWFEEFAREHSLNFEIFDQGIPDYVNSQWRFNFFFEK